MKRLIVATAALGMGLGAGRASAQVESSSEILIKGFAQYQAGRIENIVLDEFVSDLAENGYLRVFFEKTAEAVQGYDGVSGKRLIPLMQYYFDQDLDAIKKAAGCIVQSAEKFDWRIDGPVSNVEILGHLDAIVTLLGDLSHERDATKALTALQAEKDEKAKNPAAAAKLTVRSVHDYRAEYCDRSAPPNDGPFSAAFQAIAQDAELRTYLGTTRYKDVAGLLQVARALHARLNAKPDWYLSTPLSTQTQEMKASAARFNRFIANSNLPLVVQTIQSVLALRQEAGREAKKLLEDDPAFASQSSDQKQAAIVERVAAVLPIVVIVHDLFNILAGLSFDHENYGDYTKFRNGTLFLATISEAAQKTGAAEKEQAIGAVAGAIDDFVDEGEAYKNKRLETGLIVVQPLERNVIQSRLWNTVMVGSYFGFAGSWLDADGDGGEKFGLRAFGPVGIEWKIASLSGAPVSIVAAPFDIGAYVTAELKGDEYEANFRSIQSPSYFVSYTFARRPISFIAGYQHRIPVEDGRTEDALFGAIAFDLPLFNLF